MKKLLVLLLFFIPFGLFAQESVTRSEDGKSLIVQPKKHVAFFDADSVRISMKMFNDSLYYLLKKCRGYYSFSVDKKNS